MHVRLSERESRDLQEWSGQWVSVSREGSELLLRFEGESQARARLVLVFERGTHLWVDEVERVELTSRSLVVQGRDGRQTRLARLVLPGEFQRALQVGQFATHDLELPTVATPFFESWTPPRSRRRPREVFVWVESTTHSRLALWWACDSFARSTVWVVPMPRSRLDVSHHRPVRELMSAAAGARRLTRAQVTRFAANWKAWCAGDARFGRVAWRGEDQWVGEVPARLFDVFPRRGDGLQLAPYDHRLLETLGSDWTTPVGLIRRDLSFTVWGDQALWQRLHAWSRWKSGRFVERRSSGEKSFFEREYRLTPEGQRLLEELPSLESAPPLVLGAFRSYTRGSWVVTPRGVRRA